MLMARISQVVDKVALQSVTDVANFIGYTCYK